jgi:hypothetical protein
MKVKQVPVQYVNQLWPQVEQYIYNAMQFSQGDYSSDEAKVYLVQGMWTLFVVTDDEENIKGAGAVSFFNRPNDRVAFVVAIGGKLISNRETYAQFEDILRANGATCIEGAVRESIARLWSRFGFEHKYAIVGKSL